MVPIMSLWVPILVSAVFVFIASAIIHMLLGYHNADFKKLPAEGDVLDALRRFDIPPGNYLAPYSLNMKEPEFLERRMKGPVVLMTVLRGGPVTMGKELFQWFLYTVLVSVFAAYVAGRALPPGADYLAVHRMAGVTAFAGYSLALLHESIWYKRSWGATMRSVLDGLAYALLTGGTFGWLWPQGAV